MPIKALGVLLVFAVCGYIGFCAGGNYRRDITVLRQLCNHIEYMICQLQYHRTPLPELFHQLRAEASAPLSQVFGQICSQFSEQTFSNACECMRAAIARTQNLPKMTRACLYELGSTLGRFDLDGQLRGAESVLRHYSAKLVQLEAHQNLHIRSCQIFGLCAGAALAILLI